MLYLIISCIMSFFVEDFSIFETCPFVCGKIMFSSVKVCFYMSAFCLMQI